MRVEQKLQEMGLTLPDLPQPNGLYVPSRRVGNLIYIAGQTPDIHGVRQVAVLANVLCSRGLSAADSMCCWFVP